MTRLRTLGFGLGVVLLTQSVTAGAQVAGRAAPVATSLGTAEAVRIRRVVLLDPPEVLARALSTALSPWGMQLEQVRREKPAATLPGTALQASALARELDAEALVWLSDSPDGGVLWIYEASKDTIRARPFSRRLLDRARAAALALSVKTWLREGPSPGPAVEVVSVAEPAGALDASSAADSASVTPARPPSEDEAARLQLLVNAAARGGVVGRGGVEARYGFEARALAWRSPSEATRLNLGARIETGEPFDVRMPGFGGIFSELGGGVVAGVTQRLAPPLDVGLYLGAALNRTSLSGTLLSDGTPTEASRWGVSVQLRPEAELGIGPLGVLFQPALGAAPGRQRYTADGSDVLRTGTLWWMVGGALRLNLL